MSVALPSVESSLNWKERRKFTSDHRTNICSIFCFFFFLFAAFFSFGQDEKSPESLLLSLNKEKSDTARINILFQIALQYRNKDLSQAKVYAVRAYNESRLLSPEKQKLKFTADACNILGMIYVVSGSEDSAAVIFQESLNNNLKLNDPIAIAKSYNNLGNLNYYKGVYSEALANYLNGIRISEKLNDVKGVARVADNIGNVYYKLNDTKNALKYHELSLEKHKLLNDSEGVASTYINIGLVLQKTGEYQKCLSFQRKALEIYLLKQNSPFVGKCYNNIALAYDEMDSIDLALEYYQKSLRINTETNSIPSAALNYYNIGNIYLQKKEYDAASLALEKAKYIFIENGNNEMLKRVYQKLSEADLAKGNHKRAYANLQKYDSVQSIVLNEEMTSRIAEMQVKYDTDKKDDKLKIQELELSQKEREAFLTKIIFSVVILFIVLLVVFILLRIRSKQKLKDEIDRIEKENSLKRTEIETKEKERNRIAAELHDNVGSSVSFISTKIDWILKENRLNEQEKTDLGLLKNTAQEVMAGLRETLWTLNSKSISNIDLCDKLKVYIKSHLLCRLEIDDQITNESVIPNEDVLSIYRCCQEIVNNVNKHSKADLVKVTFSSDDQIRLKIEIQDNGIGFEKEGGPENYGLRNLQSRMNSIGASLQIDSSIGKGTQVIICYT